MLRRWGLSGRNSHTRRPRGESIRGEPVGPVLAVERGLRRTPARPGIVRGSRSLAALCSTVHRWPPVTAGGQFLQAGLLRDGASMPHAVPSVTFRRGFPRARLVNCGARKLGVDTPAWRC